MSDLKIQAVLTAKDELSPVVRQATANTARDFNQLGQQITSIGRGLQGLGLGAIGLGAGLVASVARPVQAYANLEDAVTRAKVAFLTSTGLDAGFAEVSRIAERLGGQLPGTTADFTQMAAALKESGVETQTIIRGGLEATANLRVLMGNLAPTEAARLIASFKSGLGIASTDFLKFVDLVQKQKFAFGLDPEQFAFVAREAGPILQQLGVQGLKGATSLSILAGSLNQAGIKGEGLGTALKNVILRLPGLDSTIAKSKDVAPILQRAGIQLDFFRNGKFLGIENLVVQLEKLQKLNQEQRSTVLTELFGTDSAAALAVVVGNGTAGYNRAADAMLRQASLQARLDLVMGTFRNMWEAFGGAMEGVFAAVGETIMPDLKALTVWMGEMAEAATGWIKAHPQFVRGLTLATVGLGGLLIAGGAVLFAVGTLGVALGPLVSGFGLLSRFAPAAGSGMGLAGRAAGGLRAALMAVGSPLARVAGAAASPSTWSALAARLSIGGQMMMGRMALWAGAARLAGPRIAANLATGLAGLPGRLAGALGGGLGRLAGMLGQGFAAMPRILASAGNGLRFVLNPLNLLRGGFNLLTAAVRVGLPTALRLAGHALRTVLMAGAASPVGLAIAAIAAGAFLVWRYWQPISGFFRGMWAGFVSAMAPVAPALAELRAAAGPAFAAWKAAMSPLLGLIRPLFTWVSNLITPVKDVGGAGESAGKRFGAAIGGMVATVMRASAQFLTAGLKIATMLGEGIARGIPAAVAKLTAGVTKLRRLLPFSPAKDGPLRDIHRIRLVETVADAIRPEPLVSALAGVARQARAALGPVSLTGNPAQLAASAAMAPARLAFQSAPASPAPGARGQAGGVVLNFSPTIHLPAGTPSDHAEQIAQMVLPHLMAMVEQARSRREATAWG